MRLGSMNNIYPVLKTAVDILIVLREKLSKLLSGDDTKAIQKIVLSLGHICVKETSLSLLDIALDLIFSLCRSKVCRKLSLICFITQSASFTCQTVFDN